MGIIKQKYVHNWYYKENKNNLINYGKNNKKVVKIY
jgi:hypothetical protein